MLKVLQSDPSFLNTPCHEALSSRKKMWELAGGKVSTDVLSRVLRQLERVSIVLGLCSLLLPTSRPSRERHRVITVAVLTVKNLACTAHGHSTWHIYLLWCRPTIDSPPLSLHGHSSTLYDYRSSPWAVAISWAAWSSANSWGGMVFRRLLGWHGLPPTPAGGMVFRLVVQLSCSA